MCATTAGNVNKYRLRLQGFSGSVSDMTFHKNRNPIIITSTYYMCSNPLTPFHDSTILMFAPVGHIHGH